MLCEIASSSSFFTTWAILTVLGAASQFVLSGTVFVALYAKPSFESWRYKSNPKYPSPSAVRGEVLQMLRSLVFATLCPAAALHLSQAGYGHAYCGTGDHSIGYLVGSAIVVLLVTEVYEWAYHAAGHAFSIMWEAHKAHHHFPNPSPFAVIADDAPDQLMRSLPLIAFPLAAPINMDVLFFTYSIMLYGYGVALHSGFELPFLSSHHPVLNTPFQHYIHHATSYKNKPIHCGFFIRLYDELLGYVAPYTPFVSPDNPGDCPCAQCSTARGLRTRAAFASLDIPDYSPLLSPSFWIGGATAKQQ